MATQTLLSERQTAAELLEMLQAFLAEHPGATVLEGGEATFDLRVASHAVREVGGRVSLHLWSEERNHVRQVLEARRKGPVLRLTVQRLGQREPGSLELVAERGQRLLLGRERDRQRYAESLGRLLQREFAGWRVEGMRCAADLRHSFGPGYARCLQVQGRQAWAVVGVRTEESAATVDGVLTVALLWLQRCREQAGGRRLVEGVRVVVPEGQAAATQARMAWMDGRVAKYQLFALDEREGTLRELDPTDRGNVDVALMRAPAVGDVPVQEAVSRVESLLPDAAELEIRRLGGPEVQFLRHGMVFARARMAYAGQGLRRAMEIRVGSGAQETVLNEENAAGMRAMVGELFARRTVQDDAGGRTAAQRDVLFRTEPERWLESRLQRELPAIGREFETSGNGPEPVYVQVRGRSGVNEVGVADLLAVTREGRLAVMEVKVAEDLHLPMQGLDYWMRLRSLQARGAADGMSELQRLGYFPKARLSEAPPWLYLLAPALRIHPAVETVLRHFDPRVPWRLVALDERWRERVRPVWRRSSEDRGARQAGS